jgi:hypothetical protein
MLILILFCFTQISCATYEAIYKRMDKVKITESNFSAISGTYKMFADSTLDKGKGKEAILTIPKNLSVSIYQKILNKQLIIDSSSQYSVKVNCKKENISFVFFKNEIMLDSASIIGKIKSNGFYYVGNSKAKCHGVPYLLGGCQKERIRLGLGNNGHLIINQAYESSGAFLFFFWAGEKYNTCYFFKKITSSL